MTVSLISSPPTSNLHFFERKALPLTGTWFGWQPQSQLKGCWYPSTSQASQVTECWRTQGWLVLVQWVSSPRLSFNTVWCCVPCHRIFTFEELIGAQQKMRPEPWQEMGLLFAQFWWVQVYLVFKPSSANFRHSGNEQTLIIVLPPASVLYPPILGLPLCPVSFTGGRSWISYPWTPLIE